MSASAVLTIVFPSERIFMRRTGRAKLARRERHTPKDRARIILARLYAFLVRYAIFRCLDEVLRRANNANNGENAKRYCQIALAFPIRQGAADAVAYGFRNFATAATTLALVFLFTNACSQNNGINDFQYRVVIGK